MRTMLMATVGPQEGESEPVIVDTDTSGAVILELDDGRVLCFDRGEFTSAVLIGPPSQASGESVEEWQRRVLRGEHAFGPQPPAKAA